MLRAERRAGTGRASRHVAFKIKMGALPQIARLSGKSELRLFFLTRRV